MMELRLLSPWMGYSRKLMKRIEALSYIGFFSTEEAKLRGMRLAIGEAGSVSEGSCLRFYWLVDEMDGVIADAKFQAFGSTALLAVADAACELFLRKNYDQVRRMQADFLDKHLRDKKDKEALPPSSYSVLNFVLLAIDEAADVCMDIPLADSYVAPPMSPIPKGENYVYPGWDELNVKQQISVIEEVIATDIRPYIELDAGGIEILQFNRGRELVIAYKGACTSCHSATGATLDAIQQILKSKVHPEIIVIPDLSFLQ